MTIANYSDLKSLIARRLHRSDLTSYLADYILLGETRIYRDLRVRQMETALSSAISSGVVAVPTGYVEMKFAYLNTTPTTTLERKDAEWIYFNYPTRSAESKPYFYAREGSNFIFGPYPDASSYTMKGIYYKKLDALSDSNTSNWLITDAPDLILAASMVEAYDDLQDDARKDWWEGKYQQVRAFVQSKDEQEDVSGGPIAATAR